jgi:hypothetical protein
MKRKLGQPIKIRFYSEKEMELRSALSRMVAVYREGHENPSDEPYVIATALRVLAGGLK